MARPEYLSSMRARYVDAKTRSQRSRILDEVIKVTGYNRKYAEPSAHLPPPPPGLTLPTSVHIVQISYGAK